jgi:hypothetical protein
VLQSRVHSAKPAHLSKFMSKRSPLRRSTVALPTPADLRLHESTGEPDPKDGLEWVQWMFQSVRAQRTAIIYQTEAVERPAALAEWRDFAEKIFLPAVAPVLLRGWEAARGGDDNALGSTDVSLHGKLSPSAAERSLTAGAILLGQTRGAKYQAALGRYRLRVDQGEFPGHLAPAWAAVAALFQLPPLDLLAEYLRQEWTVATQHVPHHEVPQGPLGFSGLAHRALHEAGVMGFPN